MDVKIEQSWKEVLKDEFNKDYFQQIVAYLKMEKAMGRVIYPPGSQIFHAFDATPFPHVKVVLLGQDPYHGAGQAHGLAFSVQHGVKPPPSLVNIFKEMQQDIGVPPPPHGNLEAWTKQGVFLLNTSLTVRAAEPQSHAKIGWTEFTDSVIKKISDLRQNVVFLLWGRSAQDKQVLIDETKHYVLKAAHPSPYSADKGFFGCRHFSKANQYLVQNRLDAIDWRL
ncbi:MAG TPA: uracil-DNA glycosylase [Chitinophagaceae bacterium]|nr:uracil-DNA glycosylase [Chitinophagaceae bacterium]